MMNTLPVIQSFFGKPVRFFRADFEVEIRGHHDPQSPIKFLMETWAIPFPDFCQAIGYDERAIKRMVERSDEVFKPFYRIEMIPDALGRLRPTIIMAYEMCQLLIAKLDASRIKDPIVRQTAIDFQKWLINTFYMINTKRLLPVRWHKGLDIQSEYVPLISMPIGSEHKKELKELAIAHGTSLTQEYRREQQVRGCNAITKKGKPRKSPTTKGTTQYPEDQKKLFSFLNEHPEYLSRRGGNRFKKFRQKDLKAILGLIVSVGCISRWIREAIKQ